MIRFWILAQLLSSWVTWGKLLDFFEPHFSYLKIGIRIVFLAHSQHSIKVSYFYCLLGKKQCKRLSTLVPIVCCCNLSTLLCYISWIRESDWHSCLFILDQPMSLNPLVNAHFLFYLTYQPHLTQLMTLLPDTPYSLGFEDTTPFRFFQILSLATYSQSVPATNSPESEHWNFSGLSSWTSLSAHF